MFSAYKSLNTGILILFMLVGSFNAGSTQQLVKNSHLLTDNDTLIQTSIDSSKLIFEPVISGLSQPVFITNADDGSGRLFVIERIGRIRIAANNVLVSTPFLDMESIVRSTSS